MQWTKWAAGEGLSKTATRLMQKFVGMASASAGMIMLVMVIAGLVQAIGALAAARGRFRAPLSQMLGSIMFGIIAFNMVSLGVYSFTFPDADVGVTTFLVTMSIIPGALFDLIFFREKLTAVQCAGIAMFLASGYAILGFPTLGSLLHLPGWVGITLIIALLAAVNELITRWVSKCDPLVHNVWVGAATATAGTIALVIFFSAPELFEQATASGRLWFGAAVIGMLNFGTVVFKVMTYKGGGSIALKKIVMLGTYLICATLFGVVLYNEKLTLGKIVGCAGFFIAFAMTDRKTWETLAAMTGFSNQPE